MNPFQPPASSNIHFNPIFESPASQKDWSNSTNSYLFNTIRASRTKKIDSYYLNHCSNTKEPYISKQDHSQDVLESDLLSKLCLLHEKGSEINIEYELGIKPFYHGICPLCKESVIAEGNKVSCFNGCTDFDIPAFKFNTQFTVQNLMNHYSLGLNEHKNCNSTLMWFECENEIVFICEQCYNKMLE